MKAFRIVWSGIPEESGIYIAATAAKAKAIALRHLEDVGYRGTFAQLKCRRAPEYDAWAANQSVKRQLTGIVEEWVKREATRMEAVQ